MLEALPIVNQSLHHPILEAKGVFLAVKRLDLVHLSVAGNKFYKLKYNLEAAVSNHFDKILTFGGAYSNHIYATAEAAKAVNLKSIGIIRGERVEPLNPTLAHAESLGMDLHFVDRSTYKLKKEASLLEDAVKKFGSFYLIPEGGTNELAIRGTSEILKPEDNSYSHVATCIGTGGTFAGMINSLSRGQKILGFSSLKGNFIHAEIKELLENHQINGEGDHQIFDQFHFGGYGKYNQELIDFIWWFFESFEIVLDPIYTGKMMAGIWKLIDEDFFPIGSKILAIHSGGLQGNTGFTARTGIKLPSLSR
jgi:1-aminocyclopropane-1-carboxylate deaminase/D-cysteine desulfhydrase-like pyridoxal-dependent ACC family enzyme